jgi:hypothetical protein
LVGCGLTQINDRLMENKIICFRGLERERSNDKIDYGGVCSCLGVVSSGCSAGASTATERCCHPGSRSLWSGHASR